MSTFNFRGLPDCFVRMIRFFVIRKYWIINSYINPFRFFYFFLYFPESSLVTGCCFHWNILFQSALSPCWLWILWIYLQCTQNSIYMYNVHCTLYIYIHIQYMNALNKITMKKPGKNLTLASILCRPKNLNKHWYPLLISAEYLFFSYNAPVK